MWPPPLWVRVATDVDWYGEVSGDYIFWFCIHKLLIILTLIIYSLRLMLALHSMTLDTIPSSLMTMYRSNNQYRQNHCQGSIIWSSDSRQYSWTERYGSIQITNVMWFHGTLVGKIAEQCTYVFFVCCVSPCIWPRLRTLSNITWLNGRMCAWAIGWVSKCTWPFLAHATWATIWLNDTTHPILCT